MAEVGDLNSARRRRPLVLDACLQVDPQRHAARSARHWVMSTLGDAGIGGAVNQAVELATAELVGQALLRSPDQITVKVSFDGHTVRVEVVDDAQDTSDPSSPAVAILDALAGAWGTIDGPDGRRTAWVEVETGDEWWE